MPEPKGPRGRLSESESRRLCTVSSTWLLLLFLSITRSPGEYKALGSSGHASPPRGKMTCHPARPCLCLHHPWRVLQLFLASLHKKYYCVNTISTYSSTLFDILPTSGGRHSFFVLVTIAATLAGPRSTIETPILRYVYSTCPPSV